MSAKQLDTGVIQSALANEDYETVISEVKSAMTSDSVAAMADPVIRGWMGRRYRNIFITEAAANPEALEHSKRHFPLDMIDTRDDRQRVAERMFHHIDDDEIHAELPLARGDSFANTTLLFVPGLITGYLPSLAFQSVFPQMRARFGVNILASDSHPVRSSEANVADLAAAMEQGIGTDADPAGTPITAADNPTPPGDVVLMGYSKGAPDILTFLVERPDLAARVKGFVSWAGANRGSYLANGMFEKIKKIPDVELANNLIQHVGEIARSMLPFETVERIDRRLDEYDLKGAVRSLTTDYREAFIDKNAEYLDSLGIPTFYFTGSTKVQEVAYYNMSGVLELNKYDKLNDMQLTQKEATPPMSQAHHLAMFHANHWDMSYDAFPWYKTMGSLHLRDPFTRYSAVAAILLMMSEIGVMD